MSTVGQIEKKTQQRVIKLFQERLGYDYLGNWIDRAGNANIEQEYLTAWLEQQGVSGTLISRALHKLLTVAGDTSKHLYDRNRAVYEMLRYGVNVQPGAGENHVTVWLIDWKHPENNHFAIAEEVTVKGADAKASTKRPDIVLYVNGIALGVLELKRSTVSMAEGIRQNLDNQKKSFIQPFFSTMQWIMAGNDSQGLRYGTIETPEKYYLQWVEDTGPHSSETNLLDRHLLQLCEKTRLLELIHDFVVFDAGTKKVCRQNQYFGVKAAQDALHGREGGIIWHTQGSGKSLTMVWLAKWIREHNPAARVLIITDRTELDEQIEKVFKGVHEDIYRTSSGADLVAQLNALDKSLLCSLIHKFGGKDNSSEENDEGTKEFIKAIQALPPDFKAKGDIHVFVDECHRTQSGDLHRAMKTLLPNALFIGFTGTPLLKADKQKSIEVFGRYIHTYKFDQAVREGVVLDLRYEARDIDQSLSSPNKIDEWFEIKTQGLNDNAKAQLKAKWGTMQRVLSSQDRLGKIVADILIDMNKKPRLMDGHGNAMLVAGSIFEACKFYELFAKGELKGKCAIVTSYAPSVADTKGEATGEGDTDNLLKYAVYSQMLADWFNEPVEKAVSKVERFELEVKKKFIDEPGQMKLLIVVDKLLTGFDAPSATYLYIDKQMRDHGLFQAICRVNRLDGDSKEYGYIVDYKDLFKSLEGAVQDYTSEALDGYDKDDVKGLLENRLEHAREDLEEAREAVKALCEPVEAPKSLEAYFHYFCAKESGNAEQLKDNEPLRLKLYKFVAALLRAYASIANELAEAGYSPAEIQIIKDEVDHFSKVRDAVRLHSADYIDLKVFEPAMRHLIDTYIRAEESEKISAFDDMSLIQLIVDRGPDAVEQLPKSIQKSEGAVAETIENNVRKLIINEAPVDPAYYEKMSTLLDALIEQRRTGVLNYKQYLAKIATLTQQANTPGGSPGGYPTTVKTTAQRALYNNLGRNEAQALAVDAAILAEIQDDWQNHSGKTKKVRNAIRGILGDDDLTNHIVELAKHQNDYRSAS
ncbi:MAG: HsdR family type I site-specific deoxyribonuclease [Humidesulfovibrio sp.]|uniref:type I restriction endonuclease subunit R n=1 Tax=Humidesulfovibrio sp. TaxID=2910988 RepID=UPI0027FFCCF9|nr:HsdR family type I site-specific deoxyribonuclease [Humidesulfovibrio sp.]MDQ7835343.1 HsdR family type I site-specific deoxyribonuclease [Humidesulfovibrio sp.]